MRRALVALLALATACGGLAKEEQPPTPGRYGKGVKKPSRNFLVPVPTAAPTIDHPEVRLDIPRDTYAQRDEVPVTVRNDSDEVFLFNVTTPGCNFTFEGPVGRFVPPDAAACKRGAGERARLEPGDEQVVYRWLLERCTSRLEGECGSRKDLRPGSYTITGYFKSAARKGYAVVDATIRVVAA